MDCQPQHTLLNTPAFMDVQNNFFANMFQKFFFFFFETQNMFDVFLPVVDKV